MALAIFSMDNPTWTYWVCGPEWWWLEKYDSGLRSVTLDSTIRLFDCGNWFIWLFHWSKNRFTQTFLPELFNFRVLPKTVSVDHLCHPKFPSTLSVIQSAWSSWKKYRPTNQPTNRCFPWCREDEGCKANFTRMYLGWQQPSHGVKSHGAKLWGVWAKLGGRGGVFALPTLIRILLFRYIFSHKNHKEHDFFNFKLP